jgi:hypothetical protein
MSKNNDPMIWICGPKRDKYDMVFIVGQDSVSEVKQLKEEAAASGLSICLIGDGEQKSFLNKSQLEEALIGKTDGNTNIIISGHGDVLWVSFEMERDGRVFKKANGKDVHFYGEHEIEIYHPENQTTVQLIKDIFGIFSQDENNTQMLVDVFSCHGGATEAISGVKLTLHSGSKYTTLSQMNFEAMRNLIKSKEKNDPDKYKNFMHQLKESAETIIYKEQRESFKASAPKEPLGEKELKRFLQANQVKFCKFLRDKLKIPEYQITDEEIVKKVKALPITSETLRNYQQSALRIKLNRTKVSGSNTGNEYVIKCMMRGIDVNKSFYSACGNGRLSLVCTILEQNERLENKVIDVNKTDEYGRLPLHLACDKGDKDLVQVLVKFGADVNKADQFRRAPLFNACQNGHIEVVKILLDNGTKITKYWDIDVAKKNNHTEIVEILKDKIKDNKKKAQDEKPGALKQVKGIFSTKKTKSSSETELPEVKWTDRIGKKSEQKTKANSKGYSYYEIALPSSVLNTKHLTLI